MAEKKELFVQDWNNVVSEGRNELVFENKNKQYGAYEIRKGYNKTITIALLTGISAFVFFAMLPKIIELLTPSEEDALKGNTEVAIDLTEPPPIDETEPPPPPPPPPPVMETVKFVPPVVTDEEVPDEEIPPPQEKLTETNVSTETQEGTGGDIIIPDGTGNEAVGSAPEEIFTIVEQMPSFPGGEEELFKYLSKNINYPAMEKDNGISGTAYVTFVVDKDGKIKDAKIARGVRGGPGCDKEALRVVEKMPDWKAGKQNGRQVSVQFNMPIKFGLR
jgi:protein TonB